MNRETVIRDVASWREDAACATADDPSLWFVGAAEDTPAGRPIGQTSELRRRQQQEAVAVCASCPVVDACRDHALVRNEQYGIWGGLLPRERVKLRRKMREAGGPSHGTRHTESRVTR